VYPLHSDTDKPLAFIGDVHGQYDALIRLLELLGFQKTRQGWRHPECLAVFLGDLIDRGPDSRAVVETVRDMVEHGQALCLLGNHELNAIHYHTPDGAGGYLRPHTAKNDAQHAATLASYVTDPEGLDEALAWFRSLPIALELGHVRAVHATWSDRDLALFEHRDGCYRATEAQLLEAGRRGTALYRALDILLKGAELALPEGLGYRDKDGAPRTEARFNWWRSSHATWEDAITVPAWPEGLDPDAEPAIPAAMRALCYPQDAPPVIFGHYWIDGELRLQTPNAFCADYAAGKGDRLCAYVWKGEQRLDLEHVRYVSVRPD